MRTYALIGVLLVPVALAIPSPTDGQSYAALSTNLSFGPFDRVRIGLTHRVGYQGYDNYCWEAASARRRDRGGRYGSPRYDHLSFYQDCVNRGLAYAYQRWQRRSVRTFRPYVALDRAVVSAIVGDRVRRPRDRYRDYGRTGRATVTGRRPARTQRAVAPPVRRGAAVRPGDRRRPTETIGRGGRTSRRDPVAQRPPASSGRGQGARRATPRADSRGARPSTHPGGRGERRGAAPSGRRPGGR